VWNRVVLTMYFRRLLLESKVTSQESSKLPVSTFA
jgi:hypothetical protein